MPQLQTKLLHKTLAFSVKAIDDDQGIIEAYGSVFNNVDEGGEIVRPGAFKRTIQNSKSRVTAGKANYLATMLWQHNTDLPIGGWTNLEETDYGLKCTGQIVLATQLGHECYELIKAGVINQFSIGYDIPKNGAGYTENGNRELKELRLWEVSPVTFAMNQEALLTGVKSVMTPEQEQQKHTKDYNDHYRDACIQDWLYCNFYNLTSALQAAVMDIFSIGDEPQTDAVTTILDDGNGKGFISDFKNYIQKGIDLDISNYLSEMQNSNLSQYEYMRSNLHMDTKAGRAISASNQQVISEHTKAMHDMADQALAMMQEHTKAMHSAADDLATRLQGSEAAYGTDAGTPASGQAEGKAISQTPAHGAITNHSSSQDTDLSEADLESLMHALKA